MLRVMIASPGDVPEERKAVTEEIYRRNYADPFLKRAIPALTLSATTLRPGHPLIVPNGPNGERRRLNDYCRNVERH